MMASTDSSIKTPLSFAISYGLFGGPLHSRRLRKLLKKAGYIQAKNLATADIIIAHSGGCWLLPKAAKPKLLIFIGVPLPQASPYVTFKQARRNNIAGFVHNSHILRGLGINFYSFYYALAQPLRNREIIRLAQSSMAINTSSSNTFFIVNKNDPWPKPALFSDYAHQHDWSYLGLNGSHTDIWEHEDRYVAIIDHYAGLLGQTDA